MYDLRQKRILFTGELNSLTRKQAQQLARSLGAIPVNNPAKTVDYLVVGNISKSFDHELTTKKLKYAQVHLIPLLNEHAFLTWCASRMTFLRDRIN